MVCWYVCKLVCQSVGRGLFGIGFVCLLTDGYVIA